MPPGGGVHSIGHDRRQSRSGIRSITVSTRVTGLSGRRLIGRRTKDGSGDTHDGEAGAPGAAVVPPRRRDPRRGSDARCGSPGTFVKQVTNRTGLTPPTQPGWPNSLQGKPDDKRATLSWEPPTNTGGTETLTYEWRQGITGTWPSVGTATTVTIPNLENGTNYTFYVQARNSAGAGPAANTTVRPAGRVRRKTSWWSQATSRSGSAGARRPTTTVRPSDATSGSRAAAHLDFDEHHHHRSRHQPHPYGGPDSCF